MQEYDAMRMSQSIFQTAQLDYGPSPSLTSLNTPHHLRRQSAMNEIADIQKSFQSLLTRDSRGLRSPSVASSKYGKKGFMMGADTVTH